MHVMLARIMGAMFNLVMPKNGLWGASGGVCLDLDITPKGKSFSGELIMLFVVCVCVCVCIFFNQIGHIKLCQYCKMLCIYTQMGVLYV